MHSVVARVTARIIQRSTDTRSAYLAGIDDMLARIADARAQGRRVAVHCVTAAERLTA
mgnify:CR=1 FL=1